MNKDAMEMAAIDFLKTHDFVKPFYRHLKSEQNKKKFKIDSINTICTSPSQNQAVRYNLIVPTMRSTRVFAGINTALKFLDNISGDNFDARIIVSNNEIYNDKTTYHFKNFEHRKNAKRSIWFCSDGEDLSVGKNDIFVFTSWKTAITGMRLLKWQTNEFNIPQRKAIYLIQDYEPGFFAWSSEYVLAESTYKSMPESIIAVFNSNELKTYFDDHGYKFSYEFSFAPSLNDSLKEILLNSKEKKRKRQILVYGRPNELRNAYEVLRYSLKIWSEQYEHASEWKIISLGESFDDIYLKNNTIECKGKVSITDYASYMLESYVGISLMISPHPSYPPLEMSTFGVRTITNKFENKDLSYFNKNIVSIDNCSPEVISDVLIQICREYETTTNSIELNDKYINGNDFLDTCNKVKEITQVMINNGN